MKAHLLVLPAILFLAACSDHQTRVRTVEVKVPVSEACVPPSFPHPRPYPDTDENLLGAQDSAERYRLLILGREIRIARIGVLESIIEACR